uniref:PDZ domain-containing protein n=1 Tax=Ditylenchus dipsaci TaxID=166011 RepID=A0A915CTS0_9BILA
MKEYDHSHALIIASHQNVSTQTDFIPRNSSIPLFQDNKFLRTIEKMEKRLEFTEDAEAYEELSDDFICSANMAGKEFLLLQQCAQALEYEEVVLQRTKNYDENCDTNIFIGQIEPGGLAEKDGRIHIGDQILQINGVSIHTRKAAIHEFSKPSDRIILLLARACENDDEEDEDEEDEEDIEADEGLVLTNGTNGGALSPLIEHEDGHSAENSDAEILPPPVSATILPSPQTKISHSKEPQKPVRILEQTLEQELSQLHKEMETIRLECDRLIKKQGNSAHLSMSAMATHQPTHTDSVFPPKSRAKENEHPKSRPTMPLNTSNTLNNRKPWSVKSPPMQNKFQPPSHQFINRFLSNGRQPRHSQPDNDIHAEASSSAYNTGGDSLDSCRSTPLKGDYATQCNTMYGITGGAAPENKFPMRRPLHLTMAERRLNIGNLEPCRPANNISHLPKILTTPLRHQQVLSKTLVSNFAFPNSCVSGSTRQTFSNNGVVFRPGDKMFTSPDKLAETIALQQRLLRQSMIDQANIISAAASAAAPLQPREPAVRNSYSNNNSQMSKNYVPKIHNNTVYLGAGEPNDVGQQYEWKVKRRADGTRYITRRPLRSRVLKAREEQLNRERLGVSTDDDAASDLLKAGKFWTREDRKRHIERNKERKQKHNRILNEKLQTGTADRQILQLSQRKQQRKISHQLLDKFTTIQEYLAHGNMHGNSDLSNQQIGGILSLSSQCFPTKSNNTPQGTPATTTAPPCGMCMHPKARIVDENSLPITQVDGTGQDSCPTITLTCSAPSTDTPIALTWYNAAGSTVDNTFGAGTVMAVLQCSKTNQLQLNNVPVTEVECLTI